MLACQPGVIIRAAAEGSDDSSTGIMIVLMFHCYDSERRARVLVRFPESLDDSRMTNDYRSVCGSEQNSAHTCAAEQ